MKKTDSYLLRRLTPEKVMTFASRIWPNQPSVATDAAVRASKIIQVAYEKTPSFFSGKSEKGILSGLFYELELGTANAKTQREIAVALSTTETTTRGSYRDWLDCFSELF